MFAVECRGVTRRYWREGREIVPLCGLDFTAPAGEITAVIGESGSGKTTLLRLIAGFEKPDEGTVRFLGTEGRTPVLSVVFQEHRLFPWMTARDNVRLAVRGLAPDEREARTSEALSLVGLGEAGGAYPSELSGGMAQRIGLARALASRPDVLLLDEAFSALDALTRQRLYREFVRIQMARPMTVVLITHDVSEAALLSSLICELDHGAVRTVHDAPFPYPRTLSTPGVAELADAVLKEFVR